MKKFVILALFVLLMASATQAVPTLQLYIDGATYDDVTETRVTSASSFDLYVIGNGDLEDVTLSMALEGMSQSDDPSGAAVDIDGSTFDSWTYGYAPMSNFPSTWDGGNDDLAKHGIYPAWYTEFGLGSFTAEGGINDINESSGWFPTMGYDASSQTDGWFQSYHIDIASGFAVHFDAYTINDFGEIDQFAPFSHDATSQIPEPATMLLFGMGLAGAGIVRKYRKN